MSLVPSNTDVIRIVPAKTTWSSWLIHKVFIHEIKFKSLGHRYVSDSLTCSLHNKNAKAWMVSVAARIAFLLDAIASTIFASFSLAFLAYKTLESLIRWRIAPVENAFYYLIARIDQALISIFGAFISPTLAKQIDGVHASLFALILVALFFPTSASIGEGGKTIYHLGSLRIF